MKSKKIPWTRSGDFNVIVKFNLNQHDNFIFQNFYKTAVHLKWFRLIAFAYTQGAFAQIGDEWCVFLENLKTAVDTR